MRTMNWRPIVTRIRDAAVVALALVGLLLIVAVGSGIRDSQPRQTASPAPVPPTATDADAACRLYLVMKTRLDTIERISDVIPPRELVTAARRQEFEDRRDGVKGANAKRGLAMILSKGRTRDSPLAPPSHPYFDEMAIEALNDRVELSTACQKIRGDVDYARSVFRVYRNFVEAQHANALSGGR